LIIPTTPVSWLYSFGNMEAKYLGKSTFNRRSVEDFEFFDGTYVYRAKLDEKYGIPHLVEKFKGDERVAKFQFNDLKFNNWKESFFVPPCKQ